MNKSTRKRGKSVVRGYAEAAHLYLEAGWDSPLPLPPRKKAAPPSGYTGHAGKTPTRAQIEQWCKEKPNGNLALRLPRGVVAIDVDNYSGKNGSKTLADFEAAAGCEFPPTVCATGREGSWKLLYRVPKGEKFRGELGPGVEILQYGHRYVMAWPSVHPDTGEVVQWYDATGEVMDRVPRPDEAAELPAALVAALVTVAHSDATEITPATRAEAEALWAGMVTGEMSQRVKAVLDGAIAELANGRHPAIRDASFALAYEGALGEPGVLDAFAVLKATFLEAVAADRGERAARAEFDRQKLGALRKVAGDRAGIEERRLIRAAFEEGGAWHPDSCPYVQRASRPRRRFAPVSAAELAEPVPPMRWLIHGVWPEHSFGPVGGEKKTLKTYNLLAVAVLWRVGSRCSGSSPWNSQGQCCITSVKGARVRFGVACRRWRSRTGSTVQRWASYRCTRCSTLARWTLMSSWSSSAPTSMRSNPHWW